MSDSPSQLFDLSATRPSRYPLQPVTEPRQNACPKSTPSEKLDKMVRQEEVCQTKEFYQNQQKHHLEETVIDSMGKGRGQRRGSSGEGESEKEKDQEVLGIERPKKAEERVTYMRSCHAQWIGTIHKRDGNATAGSTCPVHTHPPLLDTDPPPQLLHFHSSQPALDRLTQPLSPSPAVSEHPHPPILSLCSPSESHFATRPEASTGQHTLPGTSHSYPLSRCMKVRGGQSKGFSTLGGRFEKRDPRTGWRLEAVESDVGETLCSNGGVRSTVAANRTPRSAKGACQTVGDGEARRGKRCIGCGGKGAKEWMDTEEPKGMENQGREDVPRTVLVSAWAGCVDLRGFVDGQSRACDVERAVSQSRAAQRVRRLVKRPGARGCEWATVSVLAQWWSRERKSPTPKPHSMASANHRSTLARHLAQGSLGRAVEGKDDNPFLLDDESCDHKRWSLPPRLETTEHLTVPYATLYGIYWGDLSSLKTWE
ncbi:hypothetical protein FA13DRAFT_1897692 [Coprinellus micaceus]|uniref:Uncharacterized protein n=1 Tax=Coprinellus micaceus TaxID=71717 RepID=A0A4Y7SVG0_COPMI|nr:hypothetical protein FA13DRAFT_1897692 [Coprinellus micaceus]